MTTLGVARWYVDADTLGLAQVLIRARPDVTFPGDDGTRHTARWTLTPCPIHMERIRERPGPYIFALSRTRMTEIDLM